METSLFKDLNLSDQLQKAIKDMGFEEATPIQSQSIPVILNGSDVIGQAQTGTGKTCAFGIPAIEALDHKMHGTQILILCPTRELAIQVAEELKNVSKYKQWVNILPIYGGQAIDRQITLLKKSPQIIIGTPGRIMDHMRRQTLNLSNLKMVILDEADEMLNMGFREDIDTILQEVPEQKQMILFSATMPREIIELTKKYQRDPVHIRVTHKQMTVPAIEQYYLEVNNSAKLEVLCRLIDANSINLSLVFCNTKKRVDELSLCLQSRGYSTEALHGDMRQEQRNRVMTKFRKGNIDILIATDVAARGIDVDDIEAIFNYDIPSDEEYYVHRIGRTGRAGRAGKAFTFVFGREMYKLKDIERYAKCKIKFMRPPTILDVEEGKVGVTLEKVKTVLSEKSFSTYTHYIETFLGNVESSNSEDTYITSLEIAGALLKIITEQNGNQSTDDQILESLEYSDDYNASSMNNFSRRRSSNNNFQKNNFTKNNSTRKGTQKNRFKGNDYNRKNNVKQDFSNKNFSKNNSVKSRFGSSKKTSE